MHLTSGYELTTAITNVVIFITAIIGLFKIKNDKLWKLFFILVIIDSFLGTIIHGFEMSIQLNVLLWIILSIFFSITVNTFFVIFLRFKVRHIVILSVLFTLFMIVQIYYGMDFIFSFIVYIILIMFISIYYIIKDNVKNKKLFLIGFLISFMAGIILLFKIDIPYIDHNGLGHLFFTITLIFFIKALKKNS